ncbi:MAG: heavy metal translocating P-type ATPase [Oscillospiraceae bacterium]|nr:heavy metal translocating P-type ATPase [Oscillospiraceae bacterium]
MENIDHMTRNSLEALSRDNLTEEASRRLRKDIICGIASLSLLAAGLIYTYVFGNPHPIVPNLLYFLGFLIEGVPVIVAGIKGLLTKNTSNTMEILVAIAIVACVFNQDLILALLIPLILNAVHLLEERSIMGGRDVIDNLMNMQQRTAILLESDQEREVEAKTLKVGQRIIIKPGMGIPIDGVIVSGQSNVDQKSLTGEPHPAAVKEGDNIYAGTVNLDGMLIVEVQKEHENTTFSKILQLLEQSENISVPETRLIDRFLTYYIPFVLAVAAAAALITGDVGTAIATLVVSCPCGQMLVSSAPMIAALSCATKRGVLIKNAKFIEELTRIDTVVFDKTGTITKGQLNLTDTIPWGDALTPEALLEQTAILASASNHPVSRAVVRAYGDVSVEHNYSIHEVSGGGLEAIAPDGSVLRFGRREWLESLGCVIDEYFPADAVGSVSYLTKDCRLLGCLCFDDTVRENAEESVSALRQLGVAHTVMLTGDREAPAIRIREKVGIDTVHARLLPQDKLEKLRQINTEDHHVLVVGDGINDALILREADVGIAMGAMGTDVAIESADIALMNNNLMNIPFVVELASQTRRIIYQNMVLSIGISLTMIALSAFGLVSALAGSILHNFGAFAVLFNSSRILRQAEDM